METIPAGNDAHASGIDLNSLRKFAEGFATAWSSQNAASVAAYYSPRGSRRANSAAPSVGRSAVEVAVQQFMTAFPDLQITLDDVFIMDNGAEVHWTLTGVNSGPGGTGQRVCINGFEEWLMGGDGLIVESHAHFSMADLQRQMAKSATASSTASSSSPR
jgi:hypothetical protein